MQLELRTYALAGAVMVGAGLVAITPTVKSIPDFQVQSPAVQLASAADLGDLAGLFGVADPADTTATTLGGLIDSGITQVETDVLDADTELGYVAYGLLSELSTGLDGLGASQLGADALTLANDAIDTQLTEAPLTTDFNDLIALVNDLGLNSIPLGTADAASSLAAEAPTGLTSLTDIFTSLF
jgi:hypothetical protein